MVQIGVKGQNVPQVWDSLSLGGVQLEATVRAARRQHVSLGRDAMRQTSS